jgi:sulfide:quinone oxidoreductase
VIDIKVSLLELADRPVAIRRGREETKTMAKPRIVILGAGLGGAIAAFEVRDAVGDRAEVSVVSPGDTFHFVPSNPWVAIHWRKRDAIEVKLPPVFKKRGVAFSPAGAKRVSPAENRLELNDGTFVDYDYLVIATGVTPRPDQTPGLQDPAISTSPRCR